MGVLYDGRLVAQHQDLDVFHPYKSLRVTQFSPRT
jgi:hypothetical protein